MHPFGLAAPLLLGPGCCYSPWWYFPMGNKTNTAFTAISTPVATTGATYVVITTASMRGSGTSTNWGSWTMSAVLELLQIICALCTWARTDDLLWPNLVWDCFFFCFFFFCFCFLGLNPQHMEVPRLGDESELQLLIYTTAAATQDLSLICDLQHSSWQCQILNPLCKARDRTCILMDTSQIPFCWSTTGTSGLGLLLAMSHLLRVGTVRTCGTLGLFFYFFFLKILIAYPF